MDFEKNVLHIADVCPQSSNDDTDPLHVVASDEVVPIYNIMDYNIVIDYAMSAAEIYNNKEVLPLSFCSYLCMSLFLLLVLLYLAIQI